MRTLSISVLLMFFSSYSGYGQGAMAIKADGKQSTGKEPMLTDIYKGNIPDNGKDFFTELVLDHKPYADMGDFILFETLCTGTQSTTETRGQWTVLKGSARDENATVVAIDAPGKPQYFLRLGNGNLQKLDTAFREIRPVMKYVLQKVSK